MEGFGDGRVGAESSDEGCCWWAVFFFEEAKNSRGYGGAFVGGDEMEIWRECLRGGVFVVVNRWVLWFGLWGRRRIFSFFSFREWVMSVREKSPRRVILWVSYMSEVWGLREENEARERQKRYWREMRGKCERKRVSGRWVGRREDSDRWLREETCEWIPAGRIQCTKYIFSLNYYSFKKINS